MTNLLKLALPLILILFPSCGSRPPDPLIGRWQISRESNLGGLMSSNVSVIMDFAPDGKWKQTTSRTSSTLLGSASDPDQTASGTWKRQENQLVLQVEGEKESEKLEIVSASENELILNINSQQQAFRRLTPPVK